jgi:hypothetical protein
MRWAYGRRRVSLREVTPRLQSWLGHARQANTFRLIRRLSRRHTFRRKG